MEEEEEEEEEKKKGEEERGVGTIMGRGHSSHAFGRVFSVRKCE